MRMKWGDLSHRYFSIRMQFTHTNQWSSVITPQNTERGYYTTIAASKSHSPEENTQMNVYFKCSNHLASLTVTSVCCVHKGLFTFLMASHVVAYFHASAAGLNPALCYHLYHWREHDAACDGTLWRPEFNYVELSRSALWRMTLCDAIKTVNGLLYSTSLQCPPVDLNFGVNTCKPPPPSLQPHTPTPLTVMPSSILMCFTRSRNPRGIIPFNPSSIISLVSQ